MQELKNKANINFSSLKRTIVNTMASEMDSLSEPCYYPSIKKQYYVFLRLCSLTEKDLKDFTKRAYSDLPTVGSNQWLQLKDPITNLYIFIMHNLINKKDMTSYLYMMTFYMIRNYTNLMHKNMKYCNPSVFKYTLESMSKTHLFSREKTIGNALLFLAKEMVNKYTKDIKEFNPEKIVKFIYEARHRVSQSVRSFAETYYKASKLGLGYDKPVQYSDEGTEEYQYQQTERGEEAIASLVTNITVAKTRYTKELEETRNLTKIKQSIAVMMINELASPKYNDILKFILSLFSKELKGVSELCGKEYYNRVTSLMALKRSRKQLYFKQQISVLTMRIMEGIKYKEKFSSLSSQSQFAHYKFLAFYVTLIFRNHFCEK